MRYLLAVFGDHDWEQGARLDRIERIGAFIEQETRDGVLAFAGSLAPSVNGSRIAVTGCVVHRRPLQRARGTGLRLRDRRSRVARGGGRRPHALVCRCPR